MLTEKENFNFIKKLAAAILVIILLTAGVVILIDPFFHYHKPWFGLKAVLNDKEYQCIGTLRNFDYDALIVGSSVVENNDNDWFNEAYDCNSIKAVRSYGATADLCFLLDESFSSGNDIGKVFYNIDPSSLSADTEPTYESTGCPMYLYDHNPFNDVRYLFNKGVILEKIPYILVNSYVTDYDESLSYNWAKWKSFDSGSILGLYQRSPVVKPMLDEHIYEDNLRGNISLLTKEVEEHPDTDFIFYYPAYSMLWWDGIYRTGELDAYIYCEKEMTKALLQYDNAEIYLFQNEPDVITNLENYLDTIHFSPDINKLMLDQMVLGEYRLTLDNYVDKFDDMKKFSQKIVNELVIPYEEQDLFNYAE